jgi:thiamine pyrophosphokinase
VASVRDGVRVPWSTTVRALVAAGSPCAAGAALVFGELGAAGARGAAGWTIVAADGGAAHLARLGLRPHVVIGDLDSAPPGARRRGAPVVLRHPRAKDETDLELAFDLLRTRCPRLRKVLVLGAIGGRLDHTLTNLALAARMARSGARVTLVGPGLRIRPVTRSLTIRRSPGLDVVSLVPLTPTVRGISTRGLLYPLRRGTLRADRGRGVSNRLVRRVAHIRIESGVLLVIESTRDR